jgi:hypothetical protein
VTPPWNKTHSIIKVTTSITNMDEIEILTHIEQNLDHPQATGLNCLIFLSLREQTSIAYQQHQWRFSDIPEQIIQWCDALEKSHLLYLSIKIGSLLMHGIIGPGYCLPPAEENAEAL